MNIFRYVGNAIGGVNYTPTNSAIDVVVIEQPDGSLAGSPFHVNFGFRSVLHATEKKVYITVNGVKSPLSMKLGKSGEAFFVKSFGADEQPQNPLSPTGTPPSSPKSGLTRKNSVGAKRRKFGRSKTSSENDEGTPFDPSCALSDSEVEIAHRPALESKSVPTLGYLSDPESEQRSSVEETKSQIVEWKWGELPETKQHETAPAARISSPELLLQETERPATPEPSLTPPPMLLSPSKNDAQTQSDEQSADETDSDDDFLFSQKQLEMSLCGGLDYAGKMQKSHFDKHMVDWETYQKDPKAILNSPNLVIRDGDRYFNWATCSAIACAKIFFNERLPRTEVDKLKPTRRQSKGWFFFGSRSKPKDGTGSTTKATASPITPNVESSQLNNNNHINFGKTLTLTSDELKQLGLRYGKNEIRYEVFTALQGTGVTEALVYLWKYDDRIVVSDIDGTVTKSDVVGQLSNVLYIDYTHSGIHNLYDQIQRNGYKFLYLSSRGISQSHMTKSYINWTKQDGRNLPYGPILLNPSSLISALLREVWTKNPEEFKISCLNGIKSLFPDDYQTPFYAGFGNKSNDETAYTKVHIPHKRIFIIDKTGKVKTSDPKLSTFSTSYSNLEQVVDYFFPSVARSQSVSSLQHLSNSFWRVELPQTDFDLELESDSESQAPPVDTSNKQADRYRL